MADVSPREAWWSNLYPQTHLPDGEQRPPYNPYKRRDDQIKLATRFAQEGPMDGVVAVVALGTPDSSIRCAKFDPLKPSVCMNHMMFLIEVQPTEGETQVTLIPSCHEHVGALIPHAVHYHHLKGRPE